MNIENQKINTDNSGSEFSDELNPLNQEPGKSTAPNLEEEAKENEPLAGIDANTAALMCYLFLFLGGVFFYFFEKKNLFVRFAAMQSILFGTIVFGLIFILTSLSFIAPDIFGVITIVVAIISFFAWIKLMYMAFNDKEWVLPVIGNFAKGLITKNKTS